jgi:transcriptional antiterminator RfaH
MTSKQDGPTSRWYLVRTQPQRELTAEQHLQRQGFKVYLPKTLKTVRHARRLTSQVSAYFPGYLFLQLDLQRDLWRKVNGTRGVAHLVMGGEVPASVPATVVEDLITCSNVLGLHMPPQPKVGDRVRILSGPFSDHIAVVQRLDGPGRVRLLLEIMGGRVEADATRLAMVAA